MRLIWGGTPLSADTLMDVLPILRVGAYFVAFLDELVGANGMVAVLVDRPLGKDHIRAFRREHATESLVMFGIDDRAAVVLAGERGARFETFASLLGFGGADSGASSEARSTAIPLSAIQVEQHHLVAEFRVARNGSRAAAFRIARMTAGDHNLEGRRGGSRQERQRGDR
jgi:hypothetical protein